MVSCFNNRTSLESSDTQYRLGPVVKLWENAGDGVPLPFRAGERRSLVYTTVVGGRGERGVPPRPLHHQLKSKYRQFWLRNLTFCPSVCDIDVLVWLNGLAYRDDF